MSFKACFVIASTLLSFQLMAAPEYIEDQLIIRLKKGTPLKFLANFSSKKRTLSKSLNLHVVKLESSFASSDVLERLRNNKYVLYAQRDHYVTRRVDVFAPNDDFFHKQWSLDNNQKNESDINAPEAWEAVYKNPVPIGDEPVLAIVDGGVDILHEDIKDNMWVNKNEIPGNGIDDDGNGYIDDIFGWNAGEKNGKILAERHGTHVGGITGARGNNKLGISGVNPRIKIMSVVYGGNGGLTSRVLASYGYILEQKKLWLESKGKKGANIVATNSSFGVDKADCSSNEYKAWNDIYDRMGEVGILSVAATANQNWDIDQKGDVPTGCDSDFVISVTNSTKSGTKNEGAGYGSSTIDIAAPGTDILSTLPGNNYGELTGTSMATPHVTGAIGLLHMINHKNIRVASRQTPEKYALYLKNILLNTVTKKVSLKDKTVSGGILNLENAVNKVIADMAN